MQWMHHEKALVGHWCSVHMVHDYHFWVYLLFAVIIIALIAMALSGGGTVLDHELRYYAF